MSGPGFIAPEPSEICELCGALAELRPYGPRGERICFACGMLDEAATTKAFRRHVLGEHDA